MDRKHPRKKDRTTPVRTVQAARNSRTVRLERSKRPKERDPRKQKSQKAKIPENRKPPPATRAYRTETYRMRNRRTWLGTPDSNARAFQNTDFPAPIAPRERLGNRKKIPGGPLIGPLSRKIFRRFLGSDTAAVPLLKTPSQRVRQKYLIPRQECQAAARDRSVDSHRRRSRWGL